MKNRKREICTSGTVRDEDGNALIYSANDRGDRGNVGIIRSPIRASILPDQIGTNLRRERQLEGIAKAKAAGVYRGRPPSIEGSQVRELKAQGMRPVDIAKALKIGRASVYRVLAAGE
jgi:hypothetical protein